MTGVLYLTHCDEICEDCRCCCEFLGKDPGYHGDCLVFLCSDCGARRGLEVPYLCANEVQEFRRKFADCKAQHAIAYLLEHGWVCYRYEKGLHWWFLDHPWNPNWALEDDFFAD